MLSPYLPVRQVGLIRLDLDLLTTPDLTPEVLKSDLILEWGVRRGGGQGYFLDFEFFLISVKMRTRSKVHLFSEAFPDYLCTHF